MSVGRSVGHIAGFKRASNQPRHPGLCWLEISGCFACSALYFGSSLFYRTIVAFGYLHENLHSDVFGQLHY